MESSRFFHPPSSIIYVWGVEIFPLLSHHATLTSAFHSLVRHYCFIPLIVSVLLWVKNDWKYGATYHSYHQRLSGETTRDALRSSNVFSSRFAGILRWYKQTFPNVLIQWPRYRSTIPKECNPCGRDTTWHADPTALDRFRWRCRRMGARTRCSGSRSITHGSWFQGSHLTLQEVLYLTYDILRREPANKSNANITSPITRQASRDLQLFVPGRQRYLATQVCHSSFVRLFL